MHSWLNNVQNIAFLFWFYFDYVTRVPGEPGNGARRSPHENGTCVYQSVCVDETGYITYLCSIENAHADMYMYNLHSVRMYWLTGWT